MSGTEIYQRRQKIGEWDGDGDGSINFAEFLDAMTRILTDTESEARMREAFRLFDKVGSASTQYQRTCT